MFLRATEESNFIPRHGKLTNQNIVLQGVLEHFNNGIFGQAQEEGYRLHVSLAIDKKEDVSRKRSKLLEKVGSNR